VTQRRTIVISTTNRGKAAEFADLLPFDVELVTIADLGIIPAEETGTTFEENATIKALSAARASGLVTIADDSGLCVDALDGEPGIHSARYAGSGATDADNRRKLLTALATTPDNARSAHFRAAVVVAYDNNVIATGEGRTFGSITREERGEHGFGYDPVFLLPDGRTMAELPPMMKNRISHRAKATQSIIPALADWLDRHDPADVRSL